MTTPEKYTFETSPSSFVQSDYEYFNLPEGGHFSSNAGNGTGHKGFIEFYMKKFDEFARGRLPNKYHVSFYGPYVEQALLIMARNARHDKYQENQPKKFMGTQATMEMFNKWVELFYVPTTSTLNMYWAASSVDIPSGTADIEDAPIDHTKGMVFPVVKGIQTGRSNRVTITVIDDPYMMWYQFFNALFNTQFTPLVLKPTSTFHKINIRINEYMEMATKDNTTTDLTIGQMFEFNTCVMESSPKVSLKFDDSSQATYSLSFCCPNAFQGSFKERLRYMIDYTSFGVDDQTISSSSATNDPHVMQFNEKFFIYGKYNGDDPKSPENAPDSPEKFAAYRISDSDPYTGPLTKISDRPHVSTIVGWNGIRYNSDKFIGAGSKIR